MTIVTVVETPGVQRRARSLMSGPERLALIDFVARKPMTGVAIGCGVRKFRFERDGGGRLPGDPFLQRGGRHADLPDHGLCEEREGEPDAVGDRSGEGTGDLAGGKLQEDEMSDAFKSIETDLKEALAHARGKVPAKVHEIELPEPEVQAIRARTGLSQSEFARSIGVKKGTLLNWEQRRRSPEGPARVLLALIDRDPQIVQRTLAG
jgi:putative transcriptional regulator